MKRMKKLASVVLALVMALSLAVPAFAAGVTPGSGAGKEHTITVTGVKAGHTYNAYQIFKGEVNAEGVLSNLNWGAGVNSTNLLFALTTNTKTSEKFGACTDAASVAKVLEENSNDKDVLDAFAEVVNGNLAAEAGSVVSGETCVIPVTGDGYYIVKDMGIWNEETNSFDAPSEGDAYSKLIVQVVGNVTVANKAGAPDLTKKIVEGENRVDANNGSVGDTVNYELKSHVPNMDGYEKYFFVVNDTLSKGLTFNKSSIKITIDGAEIASTAYDLTVTPDTSEGAERGNGNQTVEIVFKNFIQYKDLTGKDIIITYSAEINQNAVIGSEGNPNTVKLQYSNDPNKDQKGDPSNPDKPDPNFPVGETPEDKTMTYVAEIELSKVDGQSNLPLVGAEFQITGEKLNKVATITYPFVEDANGAYWLLKDGAYTTTAPVVDPENPELDTTALYASTTDKYAKSETPEVEWVTTSDTVKATATVGEDGKLVFKGLGAGTYYIKEIKAPDGYNILTSDITVEITCTVPTDVDSGTEECKWTYKVIIGENTVVNNENGVFDGVIAFDVANNKGSVLPSTGGIGTTIFYAVGGLLVVGAGILMITKKRMENR